MEVVNVSFPESQIDNQKDLFSSFLNQAAEFPGVEIKLDEKRTSAGEMGLGSLTGSLLVYVKDIGLGLITAIASYASATRQKVVIKHGDTEVTLEGNKMEKLMKDAADFIEKIELAKNAKA